MTRVRSSGVIVYRNDHISACIDYKNAKRLTYEGSGLQTSPNKNVKLADGLERAAAVILAHAYS